MKKSHIVDNIEKYFLGGLVGGVVWKLNGSKSTINFSTETKDAVGELEFDLPLPEGQIGIYNTDSLLRLLSITNEDLQLELKADNTGIVNKLNNRDENIEDAYEFINGFLKAHNALEKIKDFTLTAVVDKLGVNVVEIVLGERTKHSNKAKFTEPAEFTSPSDIIPFSATVFREIISANKGTEGTMSVSNKGLAKIEFVNESSSVKYFVVRQQ